MTSAVVLIDLQRDFLASDGRLPVDPSQVPTIIRTTQELAERAREHNIPVVHVVNAFPRRSIANLFRKFAAIEGSPGSQIDERCPQPLEAEPTFEKSAGSAFHRPEIGRSVAARAPAGEGQYASTSLARTLWHALYDLEARSMDIEFYLGEDAGGAIRMSAPVTVRL